jgi:hypothetical protein
VGTLGSQLLTGNTTASAVDLRMSPLCNLETFIPGSMSTCPMYAPLWRKSLSLAALVRPVEPRESPQSAFHSISLRRVDFFQMCSSRIRNFHNQACFVKQRPSWLYPTEPGQQGTLRQKKEENGTQREVFLSPDVKQKVCEESNPGLHLFCTCVRGWFRLIFFWKFDCFATVLGGVGIDEKTDWLR